MNKKRDAVRITRLETFLPRLSLTVITDNDSGVLALIFYGVLPILLLFLLLHHNKRMGKELQSSLRFQGAIRQEFKKNKICCENVSLSMIYLNS